MWKFGMSVSSVEAENFDRLAAAKADVIEISLHPDKYPTLDWQEVRRLSDASGVGLWSVHLPFWGSAEKVDIACMDAEVRRRTISMQSEYIKRAGDIGVKVAVIHPGLEPTLPEERHDRLGYSTESLAKLTEIAARAGMTLAVEDLPRTCLGNCISDMKQFLTADERLMICFDVNHLLTEKHSKFVSELGSRIVTLHISDYDFRNERHWLPGEGMIDWVELVGLLEDAGYKGPWLYELGLKAPDSINRPRELTYFDFYNNYRECIAKQKPTAIGIPNAEVVERLAYIKSPQV